MCLLRRAGYADPARRHGMAADRRGARRRRTFRVRRVPRAWTDAKVPAGGRRGGVVVETPDRAPCHRADASRHHVGASMVAGTRFSLVADAAAHGRPPAPLRACDRRGRRRRLSCRVPRRDDSRRRDIPLPAGLAELPPQLPGRVLARRAGGPRAAAAPRRVPRTFRGGSSRETVQRRPAFTADDGKGSGMLARPARYHPCAARGGARQPQLPSRVSRRVLRCGRPQRRFPPRLAGRRVGARARAELRGGTGIQLPARASSRQGEHTTSRRRRGPSSPPGSPPTTATRARPTSTSASAPASTSSAASW